MHLVPVQQSKPLVAQNHEPGRFETLPNEIKYEVFRAMLQWIVPLPQCGGADLFGDLNQALAQTFAEPSATCRVIESLWAAGTGPGLRAALGAIEQAPAQYRCDCWRAAWAVLAAADRDENVDEPQVDAAFLHILDHLPADPGQRLRQLQHAARFMVDRIFDPRGTTSATRLLQHCAALPRIPDSLWRDLLLFWMHFSTAGDFQPGSSLEGLTPVQQEELALMVECNRDVTDGPLAGRFPGWLQGAERVRDAAARLNLLLTLRARVRRVSRTQEECERNEKAADEALLRVREPRLRPQVLRCIEAHADHPLRETLAQELAAFDPSEAIQVLLQQARALSLDTQGRALLTRCLDELMQRSRLAPDRHADFLRNMAMASRNASGARMNEDIARRVMQECATLEPASRLTVLAALQITYWFDMDMRQRWQADWRTALDETIAALPQADTSAAVLRLAQGLLPALRRPDSRDAALQAMLHGLPAMEPHLQARLLQKIVGCCIQQDPMLLEQHALQLIQACARLPFHLRPARLDLLPCQPEAPSCRQLADLVRQTRQEHLNWAIQSRTRQATGAGAR
ncbi:hypothetical protein GT347_15845 [Xylophilus rhododendri]|uniref:Uncharacterized protein n=1 Tax=Xylophilus rhododendri TaxID=2697032 RepID=A0A857J8E3_9BURK|nr:hypothetical protein [Xylophilus rhododendri]QHI99319.1 hypothetical protein GT347_15845 [Xylophilus rhododendri]